MRIKTMAEKAPPLPHMLQHNSFTGHGPDRWNHRASFRDGKIVLELLKRGSIDADQGNEQVAGLSKKLLSRRNFDARVSSDLF
jgi:hypothetical protein